MDHLSSESSKDLSGIQPFINNLVGLAISILRMSKLRHSHKSSVCTVDEQQIISGHNMYCKEKEVQDPSLQWFTSMLAPVFKLMSSPSKALYC